jgi:tetratricopeptide (TPR) repeat protein
MKFSNFLICLLIFLLLSAEVFGQLTSSAEQQEVIKIAAQVKELYFQGKYKDALPLAKRGVAQTEKISGKEHQDVAIALDNLATIYLALEQLKDAESNYQRSLKIREKAQPADEVMIAVTFDKLSECSEELSDMPRAEKYLQRALEIREKKFGVEHQEVGKTLSELARLLTMRGEYKKADLLFKRAISMQERNLGKNHPDLATSLGAYACLFRYLNKPSEAEKLLDQSNEILYHNATDKNAPLVIADKSLECRATRGDFVIVPRDPNFPSGGQVISRTKIAVLVDEKGAVIQARSLTSPYTLSKETGQAIFNTSFKPAVVEGKPVKMIGQITEIISVITRVSTEVIRVQK